MMNKKIDWLILHATDREGQDFLPPDFPLETLGNLRISQHQHSTVALLRTGVGAGKIQHTLEEMAEEFSIRQMILAGLCGALQPELETGQTLLAQSVMDCREGIPILCPGEEKAAFPDSLKKHEHGLFLSVNSPADRETKHRLHQKFPEALGLDMESYQVVQAARQLGLPCLVLKTVADRLEDAIPADYRMNHEPDEKIKKALEANARVVQSLL
jgi:nucleoside phosphorylase